MTRNGADALLGAPDVSAPDHPAHEDALIDAALECFGRWGVAKSTVEDIAREAGISRATVYRSFPGGKPAILQAVGVREIQRLMGHIIEVVDAADDLTSALADGLVASCAALRGHHALNFLLQHEPTTVLPFIAFDRLGPALSLARATVAPSLARFVPPATAGELVEWGTRMVLSLTFAPGLVDPADPVAVRSLVADLLLPGIAPEAHPVIVGDAEPTVLPSSTQPATVPSKGSQP